MQRLFNSGRLRLRRLPCLANTRAPFKLDILATSAERASLGGARRKILLCRLHNWCLAVPRLLHSDNFSPSRSLLFPLLSCTSPVMNLHPFQSRFVLLQSRLPNASCNRIVFLCAFLLLSGVTFASSTKLLSHHHHHQSHRR